jgi:CheY-like chemotaxis protein
MGGVKHPKAYSILLVEDQPSNALVASTFLEMMGYDFDTAENGHDALRKFSEGHYALILMDVQLPGIDGLETTRRIRRLEKERQQKPTPILAMTSNATIDDRTFCLRAGMDDYLSKPFRRDDLSSKISGFIAPEAKTASG